VHAANLLHLKIAYQDGVSVHDGGQPVCNDDGGDVRTDSTQRRLDLLLGDGV
jgi:hypothetical protein